MPTEPSVGLGHRAERGPAAPGPGGPSRPGRPRAAGNQTTVTSHSPGRTPSQSRTASASPGPTWTRTSRPGQPGTPSRSEPQTVARARRAEAAMIPRHGISLAAGSLSGRRLGVPAGLSLRPGLGPGASLSLSVSKFRVRVGPSLSS